jgi:hypothetical protein
VTEASPPVAELRDRAALLSEPRLWRYSIGSQMPTTAAGYKTARWPTVLSPEQAAANMA